MCWSLINTMRLPSNQQKLQQVTVLNEDVALHMNNLQLTYNLHYLHVVFLHEPNQLDRKF